MAETEFIAGQRWISNSEAELGLGIIKHNSGRQIEITFPAADAQRIYAADIAPLSRIVYSVGDRVKTNDNICFVITARHKLNGCYIYQGTDDTGNKISIHEIELNSFVQFIQPQERLFSGQIDKNSQFELRMQAQKHLHRLQSSSVFGLLGARVQLLPHQIYIADQVAQRYAPRVLLADEVGLGKTIEAGLIIHQHLITGRADRVLIVVPDSLVHQWLIEMLRRFNLQFTIIDEDRFAALQESGEDNPFESSQLVICALDNLTHTAGFYKQALLADWDLMVVDEAHHLHWSETEPSEQYVCIEGLAQQVEGLLLLTATPEQLGVESHFSRLKLLDPDRYFDLDAFRQQESRYQAVSELVSRLTCADAEQNLADLQSDISQFLGEDAWQKLQKAEQFELQRDEVINALLDQHGTGRILYRNTRDTVPGFPKRILERHPLVKPARYTEKEGDSKLIALLQAEQCLGQDWLACDPRIDWLISLLTQYKRNKVLLICAQADTAIALEQKLRLTTSIRTALFHEGMTLVNRDRAAAYFADEEQGAQILICSEIGSEGRNFQFSHHLVLFDLPLNPDLLEQRIGRLDRIGQQQDVHIHVPYYEDSAQSVLVDWYDQGMDAFEHVFAAGSKIYQLLKDELHTCLVHADNEMAREKLLIKTRELTQQTRAELQSGRDKLLELNSCNQAVAQILLTRLEQQSHTQELDNFMTQVFDEYGIEQQKHRADTIIIKPGNHMLQHQFPAMPEEGITATCQRHRALVREDIAFLSWEHPMVLGCLDMIIHSDFGNSAFCTLATEQFSEGTLLLEAIFTIQCPAPKSMQLHRYLPASFTRIVIDEKGGQYQTELTESIFNQSAGRIPNATAQKLVRHARHKIMTLINQAQSAVKQKQQVLIEQAIEKMHTSLQTELERLEALAKVNPNIRQQEIDYMRQSQTALHDYLNEAQMCLDAVRIAIVTQ